MTKQQMLNDLKQECESCRICEIGKKRTNLVFGVGNPDSAKVVFIGEAPGEQEDREGIPFVGKAGQFLDEYLKKAGIDRDKDLYIINTLKCRPFVIKNQKTGVKSNRPPMLDEKLACEHFMLKQIEIINPKLIVLCGNNALKSLFGSKYTVTKVHGKLANLEYKGRKAIAIYHPSYLVSYAHSEEKNKEFLEDLIYIHQAFGQ
ncbi:uracil-DNA glycosylase [bacterium]|nr:uracil-DNA glycosylase [bacterium]